MEITTLIFAIFAIVAFVYLIAMVLNFLLTRQEQRNQHEYWKSGTHPTEENDDFSPFIFTDKE